MPAEVKFRVFVEQFRPVGPMNTTVTITPWPSQAAPGDANHAKLAELDGSYYIRVKKTPTGHGNDPAKPNDPPAAKAPLLMTFILLDSDILFVGIVFTKRRGSADAADVTAADPNFRGKAAFPKVEITNSGAGVSQLTVTNTRNEKASFDYSLIIQQVSTGLIGCIDPEIENEM